MAYVEAYLSYMYISMFVQLGQCLKDYLTITIIKILADDVFKSRKNKLEDNNRMQNVKASYLH